MWTFITLFALTYHQSSCQVIGTGCAASMSCVMATDCPAAKELLMKRQRHNLHRCGWAGYTEFVCCPNTHTKLISTSQNELRKSAQACNDLGKVAPPAVRRQIYDGTDAEAGEFPHMAALGYKGDNKSTAWKCGGSLISNRYVLTAAHCVVTQDELKPHIIRLGKVDIAGNSDDLVAQDYEVDKIIEHPEYDIANKYNDIALISLKTPVSINALVYPACLYNKDDDPENLIITGWGMLNSTGPTSSVLQKANVISANLQACDMTYRNSLFSRNIRQTQICATSEDVKEPKDTCTGDSGGPLQFRNIKESSLYNLVGVTSFGDTCGVGTKRPSIYTRVSTYLDWIEGIVWP